MSLPHVLLVDDSEAVLSFERAALSGHYSLSVALNGVEALEKVRQTQPALVVLDLSMPEMDGDEVLSRMKQDPALRHVPVVIVSSEHERGERCVRDGADAFLPKPIRADQLLLAVNETLTRALARQRSGGLAVLFLSTAGRELAVPLDRVAGVYHQLATRPLVGGPPHLREFFELHGEPVCVLDLPESLGLTHQAPLLDQKLVVLRHGALRLGVRVDDVRDPEEIAPEAVTPRDRLGGAEHGQLKGLLVALVRTSRGVLPVIDPAALVEPQLLEQLQQLLARSGTVGALVPS
jgi:CheY-like chemotaxis protein